MNASSHSNDLQRHLEVVYANLLSDDHRYVSPGYVKSCSQLPGLPTNCACQWCCHRNRQQHLSGEPGGVSVQQHGSDMGDMILPRRMFLWCMSVIYLAAFVSLYVQIPGENHNFAEASTSDLTLLGFFSCVVLCVSLLAGNVAHVLKQCEEEPSGSFPEGFPDPS